MTTHFDAFCKENYYFFLIWKFLVKIQTFSEKPICWSKWRFEEVLKFFRQDKTTVFLRNEIKLPILQITINCRQNCFSDKSVLP